MQGIRGPIAALKRSDEYKHACKAAKVPDDATHYCWLNPLDMK
jgi:hypothetical protein